MDFDETGIGGDFFQVGENRVETLDVAGLQNHVLLPRQPHQLGRLGGVIGHGFFHQHVLAGGDEAAGQFKMGGGRRDHAKGLGPRHGLLQRGKKADSEFFGDFGPLRAGDVINASKDGLAGGGEVRIKTGVFLAQSSNPDDGDVKFDGHDVELRMTIYAASRRGKSKVEPPAGTCAKRPDALNVHYGNEITFIGCFGARFETFSRIGQCENDNAFIACFIACFTGVVPLRVRPRLHLLALDRAPAELDHRPRRLRPDD